MNLRELQSDPAAFRQALLIDTDSGPARYGEGMDPWQREDCEALDDGWRKVAGHDVKPSYLRAYLERGRGHSKTTDIAIQAAWVLFASRRKLSGVCCAADKDQAALIRNAIDTLLRLNPWLAQALTVQAGRVFNPHTGSELTIISSDSASSYGLLIDFAIVDELTHWHKQDLWDSIFSAIAKKKNALLLVIANAGFKQSWQWELREKIRTDPAWYFHRLEGPQASWISEERLEEQRRLLPPKVYARLWLNRWADGAGDALESSDIEAALTLDGPIAKAEKGWAYCAGLDLGLTRDHSALAIIGKHTGYSEPIRRRKKKHNAQVRALIDVGLWDEPEQEQEYRHYPGTGKLRLARLKVWKPTGGNRVEIAQIERELIACHHAYNLAAVSFDPWQAEYLAQRLREHNIRCDACNFTANNLQEMATATLDAFRERQLAIYDHSQLLDDVNALRIIERGSGYRLESPRSASGGHGDCATALAIALRAARSLRTATTANDQRQLVLFGG